MLSTEEQVQLVADIQRGDAAAEARLVQAFQRAVLALLGARTSDREGARDLSQEVFMSVLVALRAGKLREPERLAGYVAGTARNLAMRHHRGRRMEVGRPLDTEPAVAPADGLEQAERLELVRRGLERLEPDEREVLELTWRQGLEPRAIALRLGLSDEVVRARKSRGLKRVVAYVRTCSEAPPRAPGARR